MNTVMNIQLIKEGARMEMKCLLDWKMVLATGIAVATIVLSTKVKKEDSPLVLTNMFGKSKTALIGTTNN